MIDGTRVLIGSPVHQKPAVLEAFLQGLAELDRTALDLSFCFVDDNADPSSSELLTSFCEDEEDVTVLRGASGDSYLCNETTHHWSEHLMWKVARFKDDIIATAMLGNFDHLFLVDSDLVLHPATVAHLASLGVDIVSEVFWTRWTPDGRELPQVWMYDQYDLIPRRRDEQLSAEEAVLRHNGVLELLRQPGLYQVGGLGACTLLSRAALLTGVNFREIPNITLTGEDRHFCIRAAALGLPLYADTRHPPLHLYRESDLSRVDAFWDAVAAELSGAPA